MTKNCECKHAGQDALYGNGKRLCNPCGAVAKSDLDVKALKKMPAKSRISYRCTVCGKIHC